MKLYFLLPMIFLIVFAGPIRAQTELTGFFDVIHGYDFTNQKNSGYQINQFEIDISNAYKGHVSLGAAIAYNTENENMELAMAYLHYNMIEGVAKHPRRGEKSKHMGIILGKFDIPFGLDHLSFASPDRPFVSQPLIVEKTIGGWNDIGLNIHLVRRKIKVDLWAVNGFSDGINLGGSFKLYVLPSLQIGFSHASDFDENKERTNWSTGLDQLYEFENIEIKSEYIWTNGLYEGAPDTMCVDNVKKGFYIQLLTYLDKMIGQPFFVALRYGFCKSQTDRDLTGIIDKKNRFTFGPGYQFSDNFSARIELMSEQYENEKRNLISTVQFVAAF